MRNKKEFVEYYKAKELINNYELSDKTKLDYQISYKEIHADLPCDPTATYKGE